MILLELLLGKEHLESIEIKINMDCYRSEVGILRFTKLTSFISLYLKDLGLK
ncbi:Uncharacterised protein [Enterococcus faecium]|nr:Uncharacterised protein [Enterococcus faecium]